MAVATSLEFRIVALETVATGVDLAPSVRLRHEWESLLSMASGTGVNQADLAYSAEISSYPTTIDLSGAVTNLAGKGNTTVVFAEIVAVMVINRSTTPGEIITIGGGSNPWITWLGATGDAVVIGPGGVHVWTSPVDGATVTAGTGDILTIASSDTPTCDVLIIGRSA